MCDCISSPPLPLPFPITITRKQPLTGFISLNSNPIIKPLLFIHHAAAAAAAKRSNNSNSNSNSNSDPHFCSELGFKDRSPSISELGLNLEGQDKDDEEETLQIESRKEESSEKLKLRNRRQQLMRRSSLMAKQVISIRSALSLGFVSQLWVDTASWTVTLVEVRPNLLSGEAERFLLQDIDKVGDVVLVQSDAVLDNELKMIGLETLVGYEVLTPRRRTIGKVRGYTFNINSGAVEALGLDCFGISVIPSSLVSTYALFVDDVLEVESDIIVVHEAAASRIQRITKGWWNGRSMGTTLDEIEDTDFEKPVRTGTTKYARRGFSRRKYHPGVRENEDEWDVPMDFL